MANTQLPSLTADWERQVAAEYNERHELEVWSSGVYLRRSKIREQRARLLLRFFCNLLAAALGLSAASWLLRLIFGSPETMIEIRRIVFLTLAAYACWNAGRNPHPVGIWLVKQLDTEI